MHFKHNDTETASDIMTTNIILVVFFIFIAFIIAAYFIANWLINRSMHLHERTMHQDLEACHLMFAEESHSNYSTFSSPSSEASFYHRDSRRMQRRRRMRDHIAGVYQISVNRLDAEVSVSSDDSDSDYGVQGSRQGRSQVQRVEEEDSRSESDSSDDSDSDSGEVQEMRGLLSMERPLPRRVALLRVDVRRLEG